MKQVRADEAAMVARGDLRHAERSGHRISNRAERRAYIADGGVEKWGEIAASAAPDLPTESFACPGCGLWVSVRHDGTEITHAEPPCARWLQVNTLADATDLMREARVQAGVHGMLGGAIGLRHFSGDDADRLVTPDETRKVIKYTLAELVASGVPRGEWRSEDVSAMQDIKERCLLAARDWTCPPGAATTPNNCEVVAMNVARFLLAITRIWELHGFSDDKDAWDIVADVIEELSPAFAKARDVTGHWLAYVGTILDDRNFLRLWIQSSFARLEVGHQLAAALCCTDVPPELDVHAPWAAWSLILPDGLLEHWQIARAWCLGPEWIASVLKNGQIQAPVDGVVGDMVRSLIRGACLAISDPEQHRKPGTQKQAAKHGTQRHSGEPNFTEARFLLSAPVSIDLREHVAAASSGRTHSRPKVQFLVRGHWREQVHGAKRALRKRIWIQPFWKGPEDARILLRSHALDKEPTQ
ncbi:MAG TPA: hypothetical protein VGI10_01375 [Polyangiaceae bacterium]|jgi:hypothetical protein